MAIPSIPAITDEGRPFWSVMIPTYRPRCGQLEQAVTSVTEQLEPGADVEIEIVDDASPDLDADALRARYGARGVRVHRNRERLGLAGNWNRCIERARGRWLHLLHQDDFVLPGFYAALRSGIESAQRMPRAVGAAFCDTWFVDRRERRRRSTILHAHRAGVPRVQAEKPALFGELT